MKPKCQLIGRDGNIFSLIEISSKALKQAGQKEKADEMIKRITASKSYDAALGIIMEYVEVE